MSKTNLAADKVEVCYHIKKTSKQWLLANSSPRGQGTLLDTIITNHRNNRKTLDQRLALIEEQLSRLVSHLLNTH